MALTLYHVDWCPDCIVVHRKLADLGLAYEGILVPDIRSMRKQVHDVSGQYYVPVLKDGDLIRIGTTVFKFVGGGNLEGQYYQA